MAATVVAVLGVAIGLLVGRGSSSRPLRALAGGEASTVAAQVRVGAPRAGTTVTHAAPRAAASGAQTRSVPHRRRSPSPGSLPQTHAPPSAHSAQFRSSMAALWAGVVRDAVSPALPALFPERAYVQLKAVGAPEADWQGRLLHDYDLDVRAAHALLGRDALGARLLGVRVPSEYAHWVAPGVCANRVGYYEVPNARVVYAAGGRVRSFGIASMISWRGVWYVVHLGAVLREGDSGVVDEPAEGAGRSAYSGTC